MGELFLAYHINHHYIIFGPWRSNIIDPLLFKNKMIEAQVKNDEQDYFFEKLAQLPFFPLNQVRELLILINYCLTGEIEDRLSIPLHSYTKGWSDSFSIDKIKQLILENKNNYTYQYQYEDSILKAVRSGEESILRETVSQLSTAISADLSGDELRSEKNYSIMAYDRLAQGAIQSGLDIETAYQSRDRFVRETEQVQSLS
ncbi:AraC family transcriptional regulator, partial [Streptococcus uberis]